MNNHCLVVLINNRPGIRQLRVVWPWSRQFCPSGSRQWTIVERCVCVCMCVFKDAKRPRLNTLLQINVVNQTEPKLLVYTRVWVILK